MAANEAEEPAAPVKPAAFDMDHVMELAIVTIISAIIAAFVWSMFLAAFVIDPDHWAFTASFLVSVPCSFIVGGYAGGRAYFSFSPVARAWLEHQRRKDASRADRVASRGQAHRRLREEQRRARAQQHAGTIKKEQ